MGTSRAAGGICISANDIMSICEMVRCYGKNSQGEQVFPENWIKDILNSDSDKKFSLDGHYDIFPEGCIDQNGIGHTLQETFFLDSAFMASGFGSILRRNSQ